MATSSPAHATAVKKSFMDLVATKTYPVSQPNVVPHGFVRTHVEIIVKTRSGSGCEEIVQNYQATSDPSKQYIDVYSYAPTCAYPRPDDAEKYSIGDYSGWISDPTQKNSRGELPSVLYELGVNKGIVRIETDLSRSEIIPVLEKFVPMSQTAPKQLVGKK